MEPKEPTVRHTKLVKNKIPNKYLYSFRTLGKFKTSRYSCENVTNLFHCKQTSSDVHKTD
jgi:hypothetical protein